jgi:hypothetical protein
MIKTIRQGETVPIWNDEDVPEILVLISIPFFVAFLSIAFVIGCWIGAGI